MANYGAPYGGGAGQPYQDQRFHDPRAQQPSSYFPQAASPQPGYQQIANPQQPQYAGQYAGPSDNQQHDAMNGLAGQMGGLDVSGVPARSHRKRERHAYHDIGPAPAAAPMGNAAHPGSLGGPQFVNDAQAVPGTTPGQPAQSFVTPGDKLRMGEEAVTTQGRVDPEQIPSVAKSRDLATQFYQVNVHATMEKHLPPPAAIPFTAHDQGNSSPKFARLTVNNVPSTSEALASTGLPLGLVLQPFAPLQEGEPPVPVLDFGEIGPPRCRRCRTYVNPFMTFRSGGSKLVCNMCNFPNDVPPEYFAPTDVAGIRVDRMQRPELMMGTVEFLVPKEYYTKEPEPLRWLFLIDITQEAINRGLLASVCQGILDALYGHESEDPTEEDGSYQKLPVGTKIGIVTYDKEIQFYNLTAGLATAQMMVMTDLDDPFVPLSEGLFVDPQDSKEVITSLLHSIPTMFSMIKNPEPTLLPVLNAALAAMASTGGKVICALSTLPTWGPGRLHLRDDGKGRDTDAERKLFTTEHPGWKKTAGAMVTAGIGVDFFLAAAGGGYMDVATIGHLSRLTGGEMFFYPNFVVPRDALKLQTEIKHSLHRETGYQALMKVRCSNGLQVASYYGSFLQHTFGADLEMGTVDADKAIGVLFSYDGKLDSKLDAHFQAALLYTSATGQRRVRCINVVAGVNEGATETMRTVDQDAVVNIIAKEASAKVSEKSLKDIRAGITEKTIDILAGYRKNFSGSHPPGQLVLPEHLKEFAMYMLGLIKSRAFKGGVEPTDRRVHSARFMRSSGVTETALYLYSRIYALHNMVAEDCFANADTMQLVVPPTIRASFARVEEGGVYLVDNGQVMLLWLHAQVSPNLLEDLFGAGTSTLQDLDPMMNELPVLDTHLNAQVRNLLQYLSTVRGSKAASFTLARQGLDGSEFEYARMLVEDRNNEAQSYVDWLVHVHRAIQMELSGQRKKEDTGDHEGILSNLTGLKAPYWT
ncbi:COPII coat Sec23p-Sfb3p heterodimer component [Exophiala xenobiotica]|nr:COPII coat Sec23p-Sfb3p heterodimer component [Exophiala xenobiotica]KAK5251480.1 COPII coat Sec23p-Sfb3p heterodimer component [Exophiala xenobiotica]KAK5347536.1 COPII coat Sec23p-Sfb3p heterodimer component [Exophiala xenobiotica]KAK5362629.1 COPII coat Sec23p-Sfb3p heterodimer component [Exophiala xenobiotica]KAK5363970.1 COPII coat Sec23p-Sfb3p heterodimer component [Exophiala xenobiotica]